MRPDPPKYFPFSPFLLLSLLGHHFFAPVHPQIALCGHA